MTWQPPRSAFSLLLAGFMGSSALTFAALTLNPPVPARLDGADSLREWVISEGLPELRALYKDYQGRGVSRSFDVLMLNATGPDGTAFCVHKKSWLKSRIELHEMIATRDAEVDGGQLKARRLRPVIEQDNHEGMTSFYNSLLTYCTLRETNDAIDGSSRLIRQLNETLRPGY